MILSACGLHRKETHQQIDAVCQKWINAMNKDYRLIVTASYAAEKSAKYVLGQFAESTPPYFVPRPDTCDSNGEQIIFSKNKKNTFIFISLHKW